MLQALVATPICQHLRFVLKSGIPIRRDAEVTSIDYYLNEDINDSRGTSEATFCSRRASDRDSNVH